MKVNNPVTPGWFFKNGQPYLALALLPKTLNLPPREVEEAVTLGELSVELVNGCRIVAVRELFKWIEVKEESR